jgi:hypothetical protein
VGSRMLPEPQRTGQRATAVGFTGPVTSARMPDL